MQIIVPAAGLSSRFYSEKPKYLLYDYSHKSMLYNALAPYIKENNTIIIGILKEHEDKFNITNFINNELNCEVEVVILPKLTRGPADTVYNIIMQSKLIRLDEEIFIKDCDSFFDHNFTKGNYVCISTLDEHDNLKRVQAKSYVICNDQGIITNIVEKNVVSNKFCVGGYKFVNATTFCKAFNKLNYCQEMFVSDVVQQLLIDGVIFSENKVKNYVDVGTLEEWQEYNDMPVIFCDIDGTLIKCQSRYGNYSYYDPPIVLEKNYNKIKHYYEKGCQIIFTTAREDKYREQTKIMLKDLGFNKYTLLTGLHHSKRVLINDFNDTNPYPRAEAINILRDTDTLEHYL